MSALKRLNLDGVGSPSQSISLTSAGVKKLAALENLKWLHLAQTDVGDEGIIALAALPSLAMLDVSTCKNVTKEGIAKLQAARPEIQIRR